MSAALHVYRIEVTKWPTDNGQPWARYYGDHAAAPNDEIPEWLEALVESALPLRHMYRDLTNLGRIAARIRYDDDRDLLLGVLMPKPKRKHYLSASGAHELAKDMGAFGAEVTIHRSKAVEWQVPA